MGLLPQGLIVLCTYVWWCGGDLDTSKARDLEKTVSSSDILSRDGPKFRSCLKSVRVWIHCKPWPRSLCHHREQTWKLHCGRYAWRQTCWVEGLVYLRFYSSIVLPNSHFMGCYIQKFKKNGPPGQMEARHQERKQRLKSSTILASIACLLTPCKHCGFSSSSKLSFKLKNKNKKEKKEIPCLPVRLTSVPEGDLKGGNKWAIPFLFGIH